MNQFPHPIVAAAQYPITFHADVAAWRRHVEDWVAKGSASGAKLLVFPEYGALEVISTFSKTIQGDIHQTLEAIHSFHSEFCELYAALAKRFDTTIVSPSLPVLHEGKWINRCHVFGKNGLIGWQDKWFMTRFEDEDWGISPGPPVLSLFEADWGSFGIQICYDSEFPIGAHHLCAAGATLIVVPSCTETIRGATRVHLSARARALENQCFVVVAQTVGEASWSPIVDINYGFGAVYCPPDKGMPDQGILATTKAQEPTWLTMELDMTALDAVRKDGQVLNFRDAALQEFGLREAEISILRCKI